MDLGTMIENSKPIENNALFESKAKMMTTKELADVLKVGETTIKRVVEKLRPVLGGVSTNNQGGYLFNKEQATQIKQEIQKHHNLANRQIDNVTTEEEENQKILDALYILKRRENEYKIRAEKAESTLEKEKTFIDFAHHVTDSKDAIDIGNVAKVLNHGIGRNKLFEFLRNQKVLQSNNVPYQKYIDNGCFRVIMTSYQTPDGEIHVSQKSLVFSKGIQYIDRLLEEKNG